MADPPPPPEPFTILMVCTGNTGRSPMMEHLMRRGLAAVGDDNPVLVMSAGTSAVTGTPMEPGAAKALGELGVDGTGSTATSLSLELVSAADLVLTATHEHSAEVVARSPEAAARTFTLGELARLARVAPSGGAARGASPADRMRSAVAAASRTRPAMRVDAVPPVGPHVGLQVDPQVDDLSDPFGEPEETYRRCSAEVTASVERIVPYLLGRPVAG